MDDLEDLIRGPYQDLVAGERERATATSRDPDDQAPTGSPSAGTREARAPGKGPPLDVAWWSLLALELLRSLPGGQGHGGGPLPGQVDAVAAALPSAVAPPTLRGALDEETYLREQMGFSGSSEVLRLSLLDPLVRILTPTIRELGGIRLARVPATPSSQAPSPRSPVPAAHRGRRPAHAPACIVSSRPGSGERRWSRALESRMVAQENVQGALTKDASVEAGVPRRDDWWQSWFYMADAIAATATETTPDQREVGVPEADDEPGEPSDGRIAATDDHYNCVPPGVPSTSRIGQAVHRALQDRYTQASWFRSHAVVTERHFHGPEDPKSVKRPVKRDIIPMRHGPELDSLSALSWSLGREPTPHRIDIADFTAPRADMAWAYEIKPVRSYGDAVLQLWQYTHQFNLEKFFDETEYGAGVVRDVHQRLYAGLLPEEFNPPGRGQRFLRPVENLHEFLPRPLRRSERGLVAVPNMTPGIPGVVVYRLYSRKPKDEDQDDTLQTIVTVAAVVVCVVVVVAAIVAIAAAMPELVAIAKAAGSWLTAEGVRFAFGTPVMAKPLAAISREMVEVGAKALPAVAKAVLQR